CCVYCLLTAVCLCMLYAVQLLFLYLFSSVVLSAFSTHDCIAVFITYFFSIQTEAGIRVEAWPRGLGDFNKKQRFAHLRKDSIEIKITAMTSATITHHSCGNVPYKNLKPPTKREV
uniref:hypothetical protein n=1 Tax=Enterococcus faecalis TaxID=1351 RepID=UPI0030C7FD9B